MSNRHGRGDDRDFNLAAGASGAGQPRLREGAAVTAMLAAARAAQHPWACMPVRGRLRILRALRHEIASGAEALAATVPRLVSGNLYRSPADTLVTEVLPLLEACRFLEREAAFLLAPRHESTSGRPLWLSRVTVETRRDPLGVVLVIAPGNYPLFLPAVQALQALVAGNAVLWKPAPGGRNAALALERMLAASGLDPALLQVLESGVEPATEAIRAGVDKVVLTGSVETGRAVLHQLADWLTPSVMELSGCDAVFVLDGADLGRAVAALTFALRLNGSATCMAPHRLFVAEAVADRFVTLLAASLKDLQPVPLPESTRDLLRDLIDEATLYGGRVVLHGLAGALKPPGTAYATLLAGVTPEMRVAQTEVFAPLLSVFRMSSTVAGLADYHACPYALTAAIFGPPRQAEALASRITAGTVLLNDLIVSTADPRASFGGRGRSGFGRTRGREGLLAMTAVKTILRQGSRSLRAYQPTTAAHVPFFAGLAQALHAGSWRGRIEGAKKLVRAAGRLS